MAEGFMGPSNNELKLTGGEVSWGVGWLVGECNAVLGRVQGQARFAAPSAPWTRPPRGVLVTASESHAGAALAGCAARSLTRCWAD